MTSPRAAAAATASALLAPLLMVPLAGSAASAEPASPRPLASSIAVAWQRTAIRTIFEEAKYPPPVGSLYLAFTSLAVHDAATKAQQRGTHAAAAAVAAASRDVLRAYFPGAEDSLKADYDASLLMIPNGKKEAVGIAIGEAAAAAMIKSREGDGRNGPQTYTKAAAIGVWPAIAPPGMTAPWVGFVKPVVEVDPVPLDGPDALSSAAYAQDYEEVRTVGAVDSAARSAGQTSVAQFFAGNPIPMYRTAVCNLLDAEPMGLLPTTRMFARIDAAVANTFIRTWRLKYDVGFWRPYQAIADAQVDGNSATLPHSGTWTPLIPNPPYSEYTSGHGSATSPFVEVLRRTLGDGTHLALTSGGVTRHYASLTALESDTLHARIWGGLHFRDAMEDTYYLGHTTADRVMKVIH